MQKNILITGGGSGIGQAIAWHFAAKNFKVYIVGRHLDRLQETQKQFPDNIVAIAADITETKQHTQIYNAIQEPTLNYLVHNAGLIEPLTTLMKISEEELNKVLAINVTAPIFLNNSLLTKLHDSRILHMSSGLAHEPLAGTGAYCISKAAFYMAKEVLNKEFNTKEALIGSVMPGVVHTHMADVLASPESSAVPNNDFFQKLKENKQMVQPSTVAKFVEFLLCQTAAAEFMTGDWDIYDNSHHDRWLEDDVIYNPF